MNKQSLVLLICFFVVISAQAQVKKQSLDASLKDSAGISIIEKEMRLHLIRTPGDEHLEFHIDKSMDRSMDIKLTDADGKPLVIDMEKKGDTWKVDLSKLDNDNYTLLIYDFDANKLAHIKVIKDKK